MQNGAMTKARILVVDDEANIRFFLSETLSRDGHEVIAVDSGEAALALIAQQDFDLALIDLKLKGINGMDTLAAIREHSPDTAVIVLTGYASLDTAVEALRQGAHDYLFKPAKTIELRESVRSGLLKRQRELRRRSLIAQLEQHLSSTLEEIRATTSIPDTPPPPSTLSKMSEAHGRFLERGTLIVDFMRHVITLDGQLLELSPTEFDLLAYIASEAPRVITPQELVREVQGYASEPWEASNMVRYHIHHLRSKIKNATCRTDVIKTVRGVGYCLGNV